MIQSFINEFAKITMKTNTNLYFHKLIMCTNILVRKNGKYLLLERSSKKQYAPNVTHPFGGKVNKDEDPLSATHRELEEEAGINVKNIELKAVVLEIHKKKSSCRNWLNFYFTCDYSGGQPIKCPEGKTVLLDEKTIKSRQLFPTFEKIMDHLFSNRSSVNFYKFIFNGNGQIIN